MTRSDRRDGTHALAWRRRLTAAALEIAAPLFVVISWGLLSSYGSSYYFPPLTEILASFSATWLFERVSSDVVPTLVRMGIGYGLAVVVGLTGGLLLGLNRRARLAAEPIIQFLRAIPPPALLPFAILVLGIGDSMKIFIIAFVCFWPILLNTIDGLIGVDPILEETTRAFGASKRDLIWRVLVPAASPQAFAGMRTSLSLALIVAVISEMVASTNGVGYFVLQSRSTFDIDEMWSGILLLGSLGYALNVIFMLVEGRVLHWHRGARASVLSRQHGRGL